MTEPSVTQDTDTLTRPAAQLRPGDRIAAGFLPGGQAADVVFVYPYTARFHGDPWVLVNYHPDRFAPTADPFRADAAIPLERAADDVGMDYSREPDEDPRPVSPARAPLQTGSVVDGDELVVDAAKTYGCRHQYLFELLAAIDQVELGDATVHACDRPAVFATTVTRRRRGEPERLTSRTCRQHDAGFRLDAQYAGSVRLP